MEFSMTVEHDQAACVTASNNQAHGDDEGDAPASPYCSRRKLSLRIVVTLPWSLQACTPSATHRGGCR